MKKTDTEKKIFDEEAYLEEKVPVTVNGESDITVTLNGVNYRIKNGHTVNIPRKAALVIEQAAQQNEEASAFVEKLGQRGK